MGIGGVMTLEECLAIYGKDYFSGGGHISGYTEYADAKPVLLQWGYMVDQVFEPESLLDVGAAYGYMLDFFAPRRIRVAGVEPSEYARSKSRIPLIAGNLPTLPIADGERYHTVTCTEVLEHVPEAVIPESLQELARVTDKYLVMLIMLEGWKSDDDVGHVCVKTADWWNEQLDRTGLKRRKDLEGTLNTHPYSIGMKWSGRFFVRERQ